MVADKFQMSSGEIRFSRRLAAAVGRAGSLDDLQFDRYSQYWRDILRVVPQPASDEYRETIAIIDSGFSPELTRPCAVDIDASLDLTGEGLRDGFGHGTAIASLVRLVAPAARQIHVKVLGSCSAPTSGRPRKHCSATGAPIAPVRSSACWPT